MDPTSQAYPAPSNSSSRQGHPPIYPPPPQAVLPIPRRSNTENSSGTSSSGSKRRRALAEDGSDPARPRTRVSSTSDFSVNTRAQVREQYNNKCWHCGASPADVCHVIGSRDNTFHEARKHGLIDFHEKQNPQNAIALCGTCHTNFDHFYNPSFFFLPTDLEYFLNYERQDRKRRRRLGRRTGTIPARICPTAQTYQDHQINQGIEGAEVGGLYTRIVMNDFLPQYPGRAPFQPGLSEYGATKSWPGSPMASLQRAVVMLRRLNLHGIPREIRNALRQLQDAYSEELNLDGSDTSSQGSTELGPSEGDDIEQGNRDRLKDKTREPRARSQRSRAEQSSAACWNREQDCEEHGVAEDKEGNGTCTSNDGAYSEANLNAALLHSSSRHQDMDCIVSPGRNASLWRWGPYATSEDAAKFFRRVL
ncbi:uncharacterized protein L3040_008812 [Drepanopeziza brunnea f. sp. 'multigermtubi']|uniref:uncharacterized protein n=1 Tax=Drepanopeziza brunnea f. sp. 'multigermtubi' TaxID=698441 RepID=UPI0023A6295F|nr:hypothetical protein L3040_008812 [Drepanopeziza brunnea f. sp. 'multigermtubi']